MLLKINNEALYRLKGTTPQPRIDITGLARHYASSMPRDLSDAVAST
jgi:hypothetical protein